MKEVKKTVYICDQCEKEHDDKESCSVCEQFDILSDVVVDHVSKDPDKMDIRQKKKFLEELAVTFRNM